MWARSGRELFYFDGAGALTTVPIQTTPTFSGASPMKLFETRYFSSVQARSYDVSLDGQQFLMIKDMPSTDQGASAASASIVVVLNWSEELKARLPSN